LGPIRYGEREEMVFLGRQLSEHRNYSDKIAQAIDEEVHGLVEQAHQRCLDLLSTHWNKMVVLANRLLEVETISAPEFEALMRGEDPIEQAGRLPGKKTPTRGPKVEEPVRGNDKRADGGLDLGGSLPAPA
jgi:hypothetical protein